MISSPQRPVKERNAAVASLRTEAKAWRGLAEAIHRRASDPFIDSLRHTNLLLVMRMDARFAPHVRDVRLHAGHPGARIIAALWLALECEDEAKELLRSRSSGRDSRNNKGSNA